MNKSGSSRSWVNVAVYDHVNSANELRRFLKEKGVEVQIHDERGLQRFWFWTTPQAGIHVQVPVAAYEKVRGLLEDNRPVQALLQKAIRCPSCNSPRIQYPQMTRFFILPTLVAQLGVLFRLIKRECYCEDCHFTWVKPSSAVAALPRPAKIR